MDLIFEQDADKIFEAAGIKKDQAPEMWEDCKNIMAQKMAILSATMGLSYERIDAYEEQRQTLIEDLKGLIADGTLR